MAEAIIYLLVGLTNIWLSTRCWKNYRFVAILVLAMGAALAAWSIVDLI